jgi:hypothetical protein
MVGGRQNIFNPPSPQFFKDLNSNTNKFYMSLLRVQVAFTWKKQGKHGQKKVEISRYK